MYVIKVTLCKVLCLKIVSFKSYRRKTFRGVSSTLPLGKGRVNRNIKERRQFDNKNPEGRESEFDNFHVDNSYLTSPFKGCNIEDLDCA